MTAAPLNNEYAKKLEREKATRLYEGAPGMLAALKMLRDLDDAYGLDLTEQQRDQMHDAIANAEPRT